MRRKCSRNGAIAKRSASAISRPSSRGNDLTRHVSRLSALAFDSALQYSHAGMLHSSQSSAATMRSRNSYREYRFPLPAQLTRTEKLDVSTRWARRELDSLGMQCEVTLDRSEGVFNCATRRFASGGTVEVVVEWGTGPFFERLKVSFTEAANDALAATGLPRDFALS